MGYALHCEPRGNRSHQACSVQPELGLSMAITAALLYVVQCTVPKFLKTVHSSGDAAIRTHYKSLNIMYNTVVLF